MNIRYAPMGSYGTNCYIVTTKVGDFIIDPGVGATNWVEEKAQNPIAILNTHGHFDHVWSNQSLKAKLKIPIYCPKEDVFMLQNDMLGLGLEPSCADEEVEGDYEYDFEGVKVRYWHFPGHTPGCSAIEINDTLFSGDFIFKNSIGRVDFPYSDPEKMKKSIKKFLQFTKEMKVYPGHGEPTSVKNEQRNVAQWLNFI